MRLLIWALAVVILIPAVADAAEADAAQGAVTHRRQHGLVTAEVTHRRQHGLTTATSPKLDSGCQQPASRSGPCPGPEQHGGSDRHPNSR